MNDREGTTEADQWDPAAVAALYACHAVELRAYLIGLLRNRELAAEVLQATFAKAIEHRQAVEGGSPKAWLFRVAHNQAMDLRRRAAVEGRVVAKIAWWKVKPSEPPDEAAKREETIERVRRAVESLPPAQRQVVELRIYEEKTFAEIAERLQAPLGTVLTRMRLATKRLAEALRGDWEQ